MKSDFNSYHVAEASNNLYCKSNMASRIKKSFYEGKHVNNNYYPAESMSDLISFSSPIQIPAELHEYYVSLKYKCNYGILTSINMFFCAIDNMVFFWPLNSSKVTEKLYEKDTDFIISVQETTVFTSETEFAPAVAIATPSYIKIITISNGEIDFEHFNIIKTTFKTNVMAAGPPGILFCGGFDGDLYIVKTSLKNNYSNGTSSFITRNLLSLIGYSKSPICGIQTDSSYSNVCFWTEDKKVTFLKFDVFQERFVEIVSPKFNGVDIISCACVGDFKFEVFASDGTRYIFNGKELKRSIPPPVNVNETFKYGMISMGCVVLVSEKKALFSRTHLVREEMNAVNFNMVYNVVDLPGSFICSSFGVRNFVEDSPNSLYWQHFASPPTAFILTIGGSLTVNFAPPFEKLRRIISSFNDEDVTIDEELYDQQENIASLITLARESPELKDKCFCNAYKIFKGSRGEYTFSQAAYSCLFAILDEITEYPLLTEITKLAAEPNSWLKDKSEWEITDVFRTYHSSIIIQLSGLKQTVTDYIEKVSSVKEARTAVFSNNTTSDYIQLLYILSYIDYATQIINLATILGDQSVEAITHSINYMKEFMDDQGKELIDYLSSNPLFSFESGCDKARIDANISKLINFVRYFFISIDHTEEVDELSTMIAQNVPSVLNIMSTIILNSKTSLGIAKFATGQEKLLAIGKAVHGFLTCISSDAIDFDELFRQLIELDCPSYVYQLAIAKKKAIDPNNQAEMYFENEDLDKPGTSGTEKKEKILDIFELASQAIECNNGLEEAIFYMEGQKMFAWVIFNAVLRRGRIDELIDSNAPFIEEFIDTPGSTLLYKVYIAQHQYEKAFSNLFKLITEAETTTKQRMEWISIARVLENGTRTKLSTEIEDASARNSYMQQIEAVNKRMNGKSRLKTSHEIFNELKSMLDGKGGVDTFFDSVFESFVKSNKAVVLEVLEKGKKEHGTPWIAIIIKKARYGKGNPGSFIKYIEGLSTFSSHEIFQLLCYTYETVKESEVVARRSKIEVEGNKVLANLLREIKYLKEKSKERMFDDIIEEYPSIKEIFKEEEEKENDDEE